MRLDNGPADRQSHAGALRLGGKECIKNLVRLLSRQPRARIADGDQQLTILGLAVLNETHFSYNRAKLHAALAQFKIDATRLGFTFPVTAPFANIPLVAIAGLTSIGTSNFFNTDKTNNIFLFEDNLSISHGRHLIRAGVHIGSTQVNAATQTLSSGGYLFADIFTANSFADFLLGDPLLFVQVGGDGARQFRNREYFVQDSLALTPHFTLYFGLRHEIFDPIFDKGLRMATFQAGQHGSPQVQISLGMRAGTSCALGALKISTFPFLRTLTSRSP